MRRLWLLLLLGLTAACGGVETAVVNTPTPTAEASATPAPFFAPDFTLTALDGQTVALSDLRGQWVVLNFWATWCVPCIAEMPALQALADNHDVLLLGINMREETDVVQAFVDEHDIRFPILLHPDPDVLTGYQVVSLPQTLLVSPEGEIVFRQFGPITPDAFAAQLQALRTTPSG